MEMQNFPSNEYYTDYFLNQKEIELKKRETTSSRVNKILVPHPNCSQVGFFNSNDKDCENERTNYRTDDEEISKIKENEEIDSSINQSNYGIFNLSLQSNSNYTKKENFSLYKNQKTF